MAIAKFFKILYFISLYISYFKGSDGTFDIMVSFYFRWIDDYLAWAEIENGEFYTDYSVQVVFSLIWFPAITLVNSATSSSHIALPDGSLSLVEVRQDGTVTAQLYTQLVASCDMDLYAANFKFY